jgi:hypothetical protein
MIPDTDDLDTFQDVFGFRPPAEPLLKHVFKNDAAEPLTTIQSRDLPDELSIVDPDLLAAMKIRSIPERDRVQSQGRISLTGIERRALRSLSQSFVKSSPAGN